jgi:hypothetical protein
MPQLLKMPITKIMKIDGEEKLSISVEPIVIELNIVVSSDGTVNIASAKAESTTEMPEEKVNWAIPTFGGKKIKFGKTGE